MTSVDSKLSVFGVGKDSFFHPPDQVHPQDLQKISLPAGFPNVLTGSMTWSGPGILDDDTYIFYLTETDKMEIDTALCSFKKLGLDGDLADCKNFPLPHLGERLQKLSLELHTGKGFLVIRGIEYEKYSVEDSTIIYLGISSFIAEKRGRQDEVGNMIVHVIHDAFNSSSPSRSAHQRHSNFSLSFHTDCLGDITAFQTRSPALHGGECIISSAYTIYNILASTRPDIINVLAQPDWPFVKPYYHQRPILFYENSKLIINFALESLLGSGLYPRPYSVPDCTAAQLEALEILQTIAETHAFRFATQAGDLHFINNLAILHRRDTFMDETGNRRHLARMWLRNEELGWDIPDVMAADWDNVFEGEAERAWNIEPMPEAFFPLRKYPN